MNRRILRKTWLWLFTLGTVLLLASVYAQGSSKKSSSYSPVVITEDFSTIISRMKSEKPAVMKRHLDLLSERYDLGNQAAKGVTMSRGKQSKKG
jgi:hypothetical protein